MRALKMDGIQRKGSANQLPRILSLCVTFSHCKYCEADLHEHPWTSAYWHLHSIGNVLGLDEAERRLRTNVLSNASVKTHVDRDG